MKVLVFGAGSLGSLLGAHLATRYDVTLVGRPEHVAAVTRHGLLVRGAVNLKTHPRALTRPAPHWIPDVVLVCVKSYDLERAIEGIRPILGPRTVVLTIQNGLGNWERLRESLPGATVLAASVVYGALLEAPGRVVAAGRPDIVVGGTPADEPAAAALAEAFSHADLPARAVPDVRGVLLAKALVNTVINPLTALARVPNGRLLEDPAIRTRAAALAAEAQAIRDAVPYAVPVADVAARVREVVASTAANRSSMLQDVERGRPTEIEAITGQLLRLAESLGIDAPHMRRAYDEVKAATAATSPRSRS